MGDFLAIGSALHTACGTTTPVYYGRIPQGSALPAIIINRQAAIDDRNWDDVLTSCDYQVKAVSFRGWPQEAAAAYEAVHAALDGTVLSVAGYTALRCERTSTIEYEDSGGYWHVGGLYRIEVAK